MNILFVSKDLLGGHIAYRMIKEGHNVKLWIEEPESRKNFDNMIPRVKSWRKELPWVGKDGLIVFDDIGYGKIQDQLRTKGYSVFGSSETGDLLELNRQYGKEVFESCGIKNVALINIDSITDAINFVKRNPDSWVIKQNGRSSKSFNYVGRYEDGRDVINVLENYRRNIHYNKHVVTLQKRVRGVEIGVGRYFNGEDWVGPIEMNLEHKKLFPGDQGPTTSEMGTVIWYDDNENNKLFRETLGKMKSYLKSINFKGDFDINCIVNEEGAWPLEATARLGSPAVHLQTELHDSPWGEFMKAIADGKQYDLKWKKGFGIVVLLALPPFPDNKSTKNYSSEGVNLYLDEQIPGDLDHFHFDEVSLKKVDGHDQYYISGPHGYAGYVTAVGESVQETRRLVYEHIHRIYIPKMFYRNDIGLRFIQRDCEKLKKWGYFTEPLKNEPLECKSREEVKDINEVELI